jgi:hypothetical protein
VSFSSVADGLLAARLLLFVGIARGFLPGGDPVAISEVRQNSPLEGID